MVKVVTILWVYGECVVISLSGASVSVFVVPGVHCVATRKFVWLGRGVKAGRGGVGRGGEGRGGVSTLRVRVGAAFASRDYSSCGWLTRSRSG